MKAKSSKTAGKIASWFIVAVVVAGAFAISGVAEVSEAGGSSAKLFILFLGAVIVLQVVPGLMLLGAMFKGIYGMIFKKNASHAAEQAH